MTKPTAEQAAVLRWQGQYHQAIRRVEMLENDLRSLKQALAAANRRLAIASQTLLAHGLPVPPPVRSDS